LHRKESPKSLLPGTSTRLYLKDLGILLIVKQLATASFQEAKWGIQVTIENLKKCSDAHREVIARLEEYQRSVDGLAMPVSKKTGYSSGYEAELGYLRLRLMALQALIDSVERYGQVSGNGGVRLSGAA
jgi:hypothetical protein